MLLLGTLKYTTSIKLRSEESTNSYILDPSNNGAILMLQISFFVSDLSQKFRSWAEEPFNSLLNIPTSYFAKFFHTPTPTVPQNPKLFAYNLFFFKGKAACFSRRPAKCQQGKAKKKSYTVFH